jgi:hypothetical protein
MLRRNANIMKEKHLEKGVMIVILFLSMIKIKIKIKVPTNAKKPLTRRISHHQIVG